MRVDTEFLERCITTLEYSLQELRRSDPDDIAHDIYRAACVKEFESVLEQSGKLLHNRPADRLGFNDLFRHAAKHALIDVAACERWLEYRDNRNDTAHDYGERFAEKTLKLLPDFIPDARAHAGIVGAADDD